MVMLMIVRCQLFLILLINCLAKVEVRVEPKRFSPLDMDRIRTPTNDFTTTVLSKPKQITQIHFNNMSK